MKKFFGCLLMMIITVACSTDALSYPLLAHWDFEGAAGATSIADEVSGRIATIMGGASLNGTGAVVLAGGTSGQYVDLGASFGEIIGNLSSYRIEISYIWDGAVNGGAQKWWTFSQEGTTQFAMLTAVTTNETYTRYQYRRDASDTQANRSYGYSLVGYETTIGIDYDTTLGTGFGVIRTFKDGVQEAYATQTRDCSLSLLGETTRNYIGKSPYDGGNYFDGTITDFKVYGIIPEPATLALVAAGIFGLIKRRK